jgi:outer membrane protein OmpA-like peptidoglycan-associated protein
MKQLLTFFVVALLTSSCSSPTEKADTQPSQSRDRSVAPESTRSNPQPQPVRKADKNKGVPSSPPTNDAQCANYESQVKQAVQANDLDTLEELLATLNKQPDCPVSYLDGVKRSMAQIAAAKADSLTQQGQLAEAKSWLKRAPTMVWGTQVVYGDIAARRQQWQMAVRYYNQALDLIADPQATPKTPPKAKIKKVYQLASEAQVLAANSNASVGPNNIMFFGNVRGFAPEKRPVVHFGYGKMRLDEKGQKSAQQLASYLKTQNVAQVTLIGHSDSTGSHAACDSVSKKRAYAVKDYLLKAGVTTQITVIGKGKREPPQLANRVIYTQDEIDALNRRVEFTVN